MATTLRVDGTVQATIKADWPLSNVTVDDAGNVSVTLASGVAANRPTTLHAVFTPGITLAAGSPALLLANYPAGSAAVPPDSTDGSPVVVNISVAGVAPGSYTVGLIGEYAI